MVMLELAMAPEPTQPTPCEAPPAPRVRMPAPPGRWRRRVDRVRRPRSRAAWITAVVVHAVGLGGGFLWSPLSPLHIGEGRDGYLVLHTTAEPAYERDPDLEEPEPEPQEVESYADASDRPVEMPEIDPVDVFETPSPVESTDAAELPADELPPLEVAQAFPSLKGLIQPRAAKPPRDVTVAAAPSLLPVAAPVAAPRTAQAAAPTPVASGRAQLTPRWKPVPPYPEALRRAGIEGVTVLRIVVEADGSVSDALVVTSSGYPEFDTVAVTTLRSWQFAPPGERRTVDRLPVRFRLR